MDAALGDTWGQWWPWQCWGMVGFDLGGLVQDSVIANPEGFAEKLRVLEFDN